MTKYQIPNLLIELKSNETYIRNDAIKNIIKEKINDEQIIVALKEVIENDPSMSIRNFARAALDVFGIEHSVVEKPINVKRKNELHANSNDKNQGINEKTIFKRANVKITNLKAILYGKSYLISDITSAKVITNSSSLINIFWSIAVVLGLLITSFSCVFSINFDLMVFSIIGIILIAGAIYAIRTSKPTTYEVQITYRAHNKPIFQSKDQSLAKSIVDGITEAIKNKIENPL